MTPAPDDFDLLLQYADGNGSAFDALYARHRAPLYRYFLRQCRDADAAGALFGQVWDRVIRSRHRLPRGVAFKTQLYQIAHHCFVEHLRRRHRPADGDEAANVPPPAPSDNRLAQALADLAPDQREAFVLQQEAGFDVVGIAGIIGIDAPTVHSRLTAGIARLRRAISTGGLL